MPEEAAWPTTQLTQRWTARRRASTEDTTRMREVVRLYTAILASDQRLGTPRDRVFGDRVRRAMLP